MKSIVTVIDLGTALQTVTYVDDGEIIQSIEVPVEDVPETIANYAHEYKTGDIIVYGNKQYNEKVKDNIISQSLTSYGVNNLTIDLREI